MQISCRFRGLLNLKSASGLALALCWTQQPVAAMSSIEESRSYPVVVPTDLSLVTDFWRSQFRNADEQNLELPQSGNSVNTPAPRELAVDVTPAMTEELIPEVEGDLPIATESDAMTFTEVDSETLAMSDWESAESQAGNPQGKKLTKEGPSMVTAVVGIVGLIVVFGAYLKGKS